VLDSTDDASAMPQTRLLDDLSARISEFLAASPAKDVEKTCRRYFRLRSPSSTWQRAQSSRSRPGARPRREKLLRAGSARRRTRVEVEPQVVRDVARGAPQPCALGTGRARSHRRGASGERPASFTIVGLPDTEVKESRDRVRAALVNSRFEFRRGASQSILPPQSSPKKAAGSICPLRSASSPPRTSSRPTGSRNTNSPGSFR